MERRSMAPSGYITHTVSAPSLHGKTVRDRRNTFNVLQILYNLTFFLSLFTKYMINYNKPSCYMPVTSVFHEPVR